MPEMYNVACYCRLSRDKDSRGESESITSQKYQLQRYVDSHDDLRLVDFYVDDGYTGTNFERPDFRRMLEDIRAGRIDCVLVRDLSRFARNHNATAFMEEWFPSHHVRFISVVEHIDSANGSSGIVAPLMNVFNTTYAQDISSKTKTALRAKQEKGEFIGAFPSYGYRKDPADHNHLLIDPVAADVVRRIYEMYESGIGQQAIAKQLNREDIPCPSVYKQQSGDAYRNANRLQKTTYWTYATVHRMLQNRMYTGCTVQGCSERYTMHGKAHRKAKEKWLVVENTHEAIIPLSQWERVQRISHAKSGTLDFETNVSLFAGVLKCGDCGRAMSKDTYRGRTQYICGSYKRYGKEYCSRHSVQAKDLERVVLEDINQVISTVQNLDRLLQKNSARQTAAARRQSKREKLESDLARTMSRKKKCYFDYQDGVLGRDEYLAYAETLSAQEKSLEAQIGALAQEQDTQELFRAPWVQTLLQNGKLTALTREWILETVEEIRVLEGGEIEITYRFGEEYSTLLERTGE